MSKEKKNSSSAFKDYNEYTSIREERAGAILAFRAGESYDFYGDDVDEVLNCSKNLNKKAKAIKLPDGSSARSVRISKEDVYSNMEALLDRNNGTLGLVFLDKPNKVSKTEEISITSPYAKWFDLKVNNGGINVLLRNGQFHTYGEDAEKVNEHLGISNEPSLEKVPSSEYRHDLTDMPQLYSMAESVNIFDYSDYLRENVSKEIRLGSQAVRNAKGKVKNEVRQPTIYERQAEMLSAALTKVRESGGCWLNQNYKKYPEVFFSSGKGASTPSPYQALMMCLHSDAIDSTTNSYTTYLAAKQADNPIVTGEHGVSMMFPTNFRYVDKENKNEISSADYQKLQPEDRNKYRAVFDKKPHTLFNLEQTSNLFMAKELSSKGKPEIRPYEKFTEDEKTSLLIHFNDFLLKMRDNLVAVKVSDGASTYSKAKDEVNILNWAEARDNIRNGENDYPYYMQHAIRQIIEATGNERRLNRSESLQKNGGLSGEGVEKNEELIVEIASAIRMMEFGLPAELTPWSRLKDIDYWKTELKENPQILETIEREVNRSLRMIKKAEMGEKIELREKEAQARDDADSYCIASQLREHPSLKDEETSNIICVIDRKEKTADVIVPSHIGLPGTNKEVEENQTMKEASKFLSGQGIGSIKYYKPIGENYYGPNDSSFNGKEIHAVSFGDGKVSADNILDASSLKAREMDRHLNRADMLQDVNGKWTFMIDSQYNFEVEELEDPIFVHPEKGDLRRYFSTMKNVPYRLPGLRLELAQKYQSAVMKDPNLKINPFELKDESLCVSRIQKAYIYKNKEGDIMCKPLFESEDNVEERKMSVSQWKLLWLSDDMEKTKRNIAAVLYADILKQELTKGQTIEGKEAKQEDTAEEQEIKEAKQEVKEERQVTEDMDDKVFESVTFEGQEYQCRVVEDTDGNSLLVAPNQLLDKLKPYPTDHNDLGGFVSQEAHAVDNRIFYYTDNDNLHKLNNEQLVALLAKEHPEIFQREETISNVETQNESREDKGLENTTRATNEKEANDEEPYLWIEVSYYGEGSETSYELDEMVKKGKGISLEDYDYSYGEFPDGAFEHASYSTNGDTSAAFDDDYSLETLRSGGYLLSRKAFLSEIKGILEHDGGLPQNASEDTKDFVRKYCPQYSVEKNLNEENGETTEQKATQKKEREEPPILKQYNQLKKKHPDALLLFRMGDFYEAYQDDAKTASEILDLTLTKRKEKDGKSVQMTGFSYRALDTYLPKLIRAGQRVAICDPKPIEEITPAKTMNKGLNKQENVDAQKATEEEEKPDKDYIVKARYKLGKNDHELDIEELFDDIKATAERLQKDLDLGFDKLDDTDIRVHRSPVPNAYNADFFLCKSGVDVGLVSLHFGFATKKENEESYMELSDGDIRIKLYGEGDKKSEPLDFKHNIPYKDFLNMIRGKIEELQKQAKKENAKPKVEKKVDLDKDGIVKSRYDMGIDSKSLAKALKKDVKATVGKLSADLGLNRLPGFHAYVSVFERGAIFDKDKLECSTVFPIDASNIMNIALKFDTFGKDKNDNHVELAEGTIDIVSEGVRKGDRIKFSENISYDELLDMAHGKIEEFRAEQSHAEETGRADGLNAKETVEEEETESRQHSMRR